MRYGRGMSQANDPLDVLRPVHMKLVDGKPRLHAHDGRWISRKTSEMPTAPVVADKGDHVLVAREDWDTLRIEAAQEGLGA